MKNEIMKYLLFSITKDNHTFRISANQNSTLCSYHYCQHKYTTSLIFASNIYASVKYKTVEFRGRVTKQDIWHVNLDSSLILKKHRKAYYFDIPIPMQDRDLSNFSPDNVIFLENIECLYNLLINSFPDQYSHIKNKEEFKNQLYEYLSLHYSDLSDLDEMVEYEGGFDENENPIIFQGTVRSMLLDHCKDFFICFIESEFDNKNLDSIFILENIVKEVPELHSIPSTILQNQLEILLDEKHLEIAKPDIFYYRSVELFEIGTNLYDLCQKYLFKASIKEKIDVILSDKDISDTNKNEIYNYFISNYDDEYIPNDKEFVQDVLNYTNKYLLFYNLYSKFTSLFNSNHIELKWDDETLQLFQKYENKECLVDSQHSAEYEVYKYVKPYFYEHFFVKGTNKYRPVIEHLPHFTSYATSVFNILFQNNILIDNDELIIYNKNGNFDLAFKELTSLERK